MANSDYSLGSYLGPNMMESIKVMKADPSATGTATPGATASAPTGATAPNATGQRFSGSTAATSGTDYQGIYDAAVSDPAQIPQGQSGYVKAAGPGNSWVLSPKGKLGAQSYQVTQDGSVFAKAVRPNSSYEKVAGAGTVQTASGA